MSPGPRAVLITSDQARHRYVAGVLARGLRLEGIVSEAKGAPAPAPMSESASEPELHPDDARVVSAHFAERDRVEADLLGPAPGFPDVELRKVVKGGSNDLDVFHWVEGLDPDLVLLYGSSIIRPPLLDTWSGRMINLHLGLSPYYRGSGTNFWPLVNGEPELVGATLHLAVAKVDAGPILAQVRPEARPGDRAHHLGTKTLMAAAELLPDVAEAFHRGSLEGVEQDLSGGRVYRTRDFTADAVRTLWRNLEEGMMERFLAERERRLAAVPIVRWPPEAG